MENKNYLEIDILKGFAICFVIILHSINLSLETQRNFPIFFFLFLTAVPIFLVILGINFSMSITRNNNTGFALTKLYNVKCMKGKLKRMMIPFLIIFLVNLIIGILFFNLKPKNNFKLNPLTIPFFQLPIKGIGQYYVGIYFQTILLFPLLFYLYKKNPKKTLFGCFILNLLHAVFIYYIYLFKRDSLFGFRIIFLLVIEYPSFIFKGLFLISLGMYIFENYQKGKLIPFLKRNNIFIFGFIIGFIYLVFYLYFTPADFTVYIFCIFLLWIIGSFYYVFFVLISLEFFPRKTRNQVIRFIAYLGKCSYHIFLVQLLWCGLFRAKGLLYYTEPVFYFELKTILFMLIYSFINIVYSVMLGVLFYEFDKRYLKNHRT